MADYDNTLRPTNHGDDPNNLRTPLSTPKADREAHAADLQRVIQQRTAEREDILFGSGKNKFK